MMDATYTSVLRLWEQEPSMKDISRRLNISHGKVLKILVTAGAVETAESKMYAQGKSPAEIAEALGKTEKRRKINEHSPIHMAKGKHTKD